MDQSIITRYLSGEATIDDLRLLNKWIRENDEHKKELLNQKMICILSERGSERHSEYLQRDFEDLRTRIASKQSIAPRQKNRNRELLHWIWRAAAILAIPVTIFATLHFAKLGERNEPVAYNEIRVPKSQRSTVSLSDGSSIQLNSGSNLRYPCTFDGDTREVFLQGEAYFQISENKDRPFIVHTGALDVRVTGTEFNISAYPEDQTITTTLVSGSVYVLARGNEHEKLKLNPSDQLVYQKASQTTLKEQVNTKMYTSWTSGEYIFQNQSLGRILKTIERWYDVDIVVHDSGFLDQRLSGRFMNHEPLDQVMKVIRITTPVEFEIREKTVIMTMKE